MSAKPPVHLRRGSRKGKKEKLRDVLNPDMISLPQGDFRHTIHIGNRGLDDMFGDVSFLQGKLHLLPDQHRATLTQKVSHGLGRTASLRLGQHYQQAPLENLSPLLKNAISLPMIGDPGVPSPPAAEAPPKPPRLHLDGESQDREPPPNASKADSPETGDASNPGHHKVPDRTEKLLSHAASLLSLQLDLGPSILEDILEVMDQKQDLPPGVTSLGPESGSKCEILSSK